MRYISEITKASFRGISETIPGESSFSSELEVNGYGLLRSHVSRRGDGVACFIKISIAYNYKDNFCMNTESTIVDIYMPKS